MIEFNCRFGDPETQPIMLLRMKSDLVELCLSTPARASWTRNLRVGHRASLGVGDAAGGYPPAQYGR